MARFIERVLLPTDGSDGALSGARRGIALASQTAASVYVLSVVDAPVVVDDAAIASLESRAEEAVETVANMARDYDEGIDVTTAVERGTPFQAVREYAHRHEIDVIAMGTKGRTGLDRFLLGSVTENVLRTARVPVLAVPPDADEPGIADVAFDRLLLPTDGSEGAEIAAEWGVALADHLGSDVHSLYAVDPAPPNHEPDAVIEALERRAEAAIEATSERADAVDVAVTESIETGSPANTILAYASDHEVDLIVMGTHGRTGVGQWFLGSITENVVRGADVPVLCVPVTAPSP